jgi:hypothetical protein
MAARSRAALILPLRHLHLHDFLKQHSTIDSSTVRTIATPQRRIQRGDRRACSIVIVIAWTLFCFTARASCAGHSD